MRIVINTRVSGDHKKVMKGFDLALFEALAPKQSKIEVVEFTGSKKGDRVHVRFLSPFKADWTSNITEDFENEQESYFIDEGDIMPFGLTFWKHKHIVKRVDETQSIIVDDIEYKTKNGLLTLLLYPAFYFGFYQRKKVYREYFHA